MNRNSFPRDTIMFFLDDNYIESGKHIAFCYGGYFCKGNLEDLYKTIIETKINLGLEEWMPVKWNFSKELEDFYKKYYREKSGERWNEIKNRSYEIRRELIYQVIDSIKIRFSVFSTEKEYKRDDLRNWMIENLFQRIGFDMRPSSLNIVMCDFEHHKEKAKIVLEEEYFYAYHFAGTYISCPLKNRGAFPSLAYSSTYYNPFLQIADIIVGCMGELIRNWLKSENVRDFTKGIFNILKNSFVKNDKGEIFRYGIISRPENFESFLIEQGLL